MPEDLDRSYNDKNSRTGYTPCGYFLYIVDVTQQIF